MGSDQGPSRIRVEGSEAGLRVLIIQPWVRLGGAELISVQLAYELRKMGHLTAIVCTFLDDAGMPEQVREVDFVLPVRWLSRLCQRSRLCFFVLAPWILLALTWAQSSKADVLNPHNFPASWVAAVVGTLRKIPIVWTCNEPPQRLPLRDAWRLGIGDFLGWLLASSWIDKLLVKRVSRVYVPSEMTSRQVRARYGLNPAVIRLGVDSYFSQEGNRNGLERRMGLEGKFVLLTVGKLHPQKNQVVCIEAMRLILPMVPNAVLVLVGDGPMAKEWCSRAIQMGIASHVRFLGARTPSDVRELYRICDINLFPPINQSWGLTPLEALCAGKISVVSNECGAAEVLESEHLGIVCEPSAGAFAQAVIRICSSPEVHEQMAARGRDYVVRNLTWAGYSKKVLILLRAAAEGRADAIDILA